MFNTIITSDKKIYSYLGNIAVIAMLAFFIYGSLATAHRWRMEFQPNVAIDLSLRSLPIYAIYSLFRAIIAYVMSLCFTLILGYWAAKNKTAEKIIIPLLDVGQSIPVLGFLPGLVLSLIAIFPQSNLGLELACIIMIFTSQVWNMTFSFYSSLKLLPEYFNELSDNIGLSSSKKLCLIELPYSASSLAWNSLMSMAGGWFFLAVCEAFTLGEKKFCLYGIGSYIATAVDKGDMHAVLYGFIAMVILILIMDFCIWRPIISWTHKFKIDEQGEIFNDVPLITLLLNKSSLIKFLSKIYDKLIMFLENKYVITIGKKINITLDSRCKKMINIFCVVMFMFLLYTFTTKIISLLMPLSFTDYINILHGTLLTFLRILFVLLIASIWTIPCAIYVGLSHSRTKFFQAIIQIASSFPAPVLYPFMLIIFDKYNIDLNIGSSILMLLGVQWYVLFNVLAGATLISAELRDVLKLANASKRQIWLDLYLPSIFPYLITGWLTAAGGAWNASIIAEYLTYKGKIIKTLGIGQLISEATAQGNFSFLAGCLIMMIITVVILNQLVWKKCYHIVQKKYSFNR